MCNDVCGGEVCLSSFYVEKKSHFALRMFFTRNQTVNPTLSRDNTSSNRQLKDGHSLTEGVFQRRLDTFR